MKANQLDLTFTSLAENIIVTRMLIASIGTQLDFSVNDIEELKVVVSEAVTNAIIHGYHSEPDGLVQLHLEINEESLRIIVHDDGCGIENILQALQPAFSTDPERMGLGFTFMQSFMDDLKVESKVNEGTTVIMTKRLTATPSSL